MSDLLRCQACGGAVVWDAAQAGAACLYCATVALELDTGGEVPQPEAYLPAAISAAQADASFRAWVTRAWLRPRALRDTQLELRALLLPVWRFDVHLETHWAGLRLAPTRSGKAPVTGLAHADLRHLVAASGALTQAELSALAPFFDEAVGTSAQTREWSEREGEDALWEPPSLTRRGARVRAREGLAQRHHARLLREQGLVRARVSPLIEDRGVELLLVPIYIGSYRFADRGYRVLVNARTSKVVADAPIDWRKVAGLAALALVVAVAWLLWTQAR